MNQFDEREEKAMCDLLDRMTSKNDFWATVKPISEKCGFQRFGLQLHEEDFELDGVGYRGFNLRDRSEFRKANSGFSVVKNDEKEFRVELDVWPFKHNELYVMVVPGKHFTVKGEHEQRFEDNSDCTRKFQRYYCLPKGCNSSTIECSYCNGVLEFKVNKQAVADEQQQEARLVNIDLPTCKKGRVDIEEQYIPVKPTEIREVPISKDESEPVAEPREEVSKIIGILETLQDLQPVENVLQAIATNKDLMCEEVVTALKTLKKDLPEVKVISREEQMESSIDNENSNVQLEGDKDAALTGDKDAALTGDKDAALTGDKGK